MSGENFHNTGGEVPPTPPGGPGNGPGEGGKDDSGVFSQRVEHQPVSARVPERVARGALASAVVVHEGPTEFILDFLQGLTRPAHVAARVVMVPTVVGRFLGAANENIARFTSTFGPPPPLPRPGGHRPTIQEIYENFKIGDDLLSGTYANAVLIGHSASEFFFDFITGFYPTACVSSRVYVSAAQMPRMIEAIGNSYRQYEQRQAKGREEGREESANP